MVKGSPSPGGTPSSDLHEVFLSPTLLLHLCTPILLFLCMGGKTRKLGFLCSLEPITYYVAQAALDLVVLLPLSLPNDEACGPCPAFSCVEESPKRDTYCGLVPVFLFSLCAFSISFAACSSLCPATVLLCSRFPGSQTLALYTVGIVKCQSASCPSLTAFPCPQEEPAAPRELGLGLGLGLKDKEEAVVAAAAGLEEASAAVAVGAGGAPAGPAVIGPSLPLALAMPLPEPEPLPLPLEVVRGLLPPLRIPELLSLRPRPRPPRPEPPPGLMALEVSRELRRGDRKGQERPEAYEFHTQRVPGEGRQPLILHVWKQI